MTEGRLSASAGQYLQANGMNVPPPPIASDPLVAGAVPIEQLLRVLGLAANLGDPRTTARAWKNTPNGTPRPQRPPPSSPPRTRMRRRR